MTALRELGPGLWIAEAPHALAGVQAGRRSAIVRLRGGDLLVHSPAPLDAELRRALDALGPVRLVLAPNAFHGHVSMGDYAAAYPAAQLIAAPGLDGRRRDLPFAAVLGDVPDPRWAEDLDQAVLLGHRFIPEVVFCHRASRSLLVGDLVWNLTSAHPRGTRLFAGGTGVHPTPLFRSGIRNREAARGSLERILAWDFDRIVVGHGALVESGGREALRSAYAALLR